jgi:hypothetical protein
MVTSGGNVCAAALGGGLRAGHRETATIPYAHHDVHLDNPSEWLLALRQFLACHRRS